MQNADPFTALIRHMRLLGHALVALCSAWVAVVGLALVFRVSPVDMHNYRSPVVKREIAQCTGPFAERYDCSEDILLSGEQLDIGSLILRVAVTALLPCTAWGVWVFSMRRTLEMCAAVNARLAWEQHLREQRRHRFIQPA